MNPFAFLEVEEVNESTKNPQRKLAKMKRRYSEKPSHDLKSRIDEMDQRINPKFKKKKSGDLPAISTASLPDIVFMLLFFFMVVTVLRDSNLLVQNTLPKADQLEKLKKDRSVYIYAGKPSSRYQDKYGNQGKIQIGDKFTDITNVKFALTEAREGLRRLDNSHSRDYHGLRP